MSLKVKIKTKFDNKKYILDALSQVGYKFREAKSGENLSTKSTFKGKTNKYGLMLFIVFFFFINIFAQNPSVVNGVATYTANKNIGKKYPVPDSWNKIIIKANVTITGSFYMATRTKAIEISGESRISSIIQGDGSRPTDDGINGRSYSSIRCDKSPDLYVHDLKITKPMKFHIHGGFGNVTVERCDIIAGTETYTTDGIHGGIGKTVVKDCYIDCYDDALYTVECKLVENTTIVHNKNGGPFMTSWGGSVPNNHVCIIRKCKVIDNYSGTDYNHGIVSWAGKNDDASQTITLKFEDTFDYEINPGKKSSIMYTIGRPGQPGLNNAHIVVEGIWPRKTSIDTRNSTNSDVKFKNEVVVGISEYAIVNPFKENIKVYHNAITTCSKIKPEVYTATGRKINLIISGIQNGYTIDAKNLTSGLYVIKSGNDVLKVTKK